MQLGALHREVSPFYAMEENILAWKYIPQFTFDDKSARAKMSPLKQTLNLFSLETYNHHKLKHCQLFLLSPN